MKIALIPVYVDYYETNVPGLLISKEALIERVKVAIGGDHQVVTFDKVKDVVSARLARETLDLNRFDCVIVLPLVATFSVLTDELVKGLGTPLVLFSSLIGREFPKPMTMSKVVGESQSFGAQATANGWMRRGIKFHVIHQAAGTKEGNAALGTLLKILEVSKRIRALKIGLIGEAFAGMTDVVLPAKRFQMDTGSLIIPISMKRVHAVMKGFSLREIDEMETQLRRVFKFGRFSPIEKQYSLRAALAIGKIAAAAELDCAAFNSHSALGLKNPGLGLMCALGITLSTTNGCPVAEVGDLCTAFALWVGRQLSGACFYTELDSAYISARHWLLLNSGEHDLAWVRKGVRPKLMRNANFEGVNGRGASVCAPLRVGAATMINFTPTPFGAKPYRVQFCEGTIDRTWHPEMGVGNAHFQVQGDARVIYEEWLAAGPVHHSATCPGHLGNGLRLLCEMQNWSCLQVS